MIKLVEAESQVQGSRQQAQKLQKNIADMRVRLSNISTLQAQLSELQRKYDIAEGVYKGIVAQFQQDKVGAFNYYPTVQTLDTPTVGNKPISPRRSFIALGALLASLFGSAALLMLLDSKDPLFKMKDSDGLELPTLARIPPLQELFSISEGDFASNVEFQRLASAISLMQLTSNRVMISSPSNGEGKTTVSLGLAIALTDLGFNVLLVDGDLRRGSLSQRLGITPFGIPDAELAPIFIKDRLDLLPPGQRSKTERVVEIVAQGGFRDLLFTHEGNGKYDYVIVDSAPIGLTGEAALMAAAIQQMLLVVRMGISMREQVQDSLEHLKCHNVKVLGLVLNGAEKPANSYYQYQYQYQEDTKVAL